ncbi:MAG: phosphatidate cytidylyltransferase [Candidatus Omnitrophota bacterium]|nr:phosphatidate cytidylyltransferase [Candidatus Omnitrophota bacterium]
MTVKRVISALFLIGLSVISILVNWVFAVLVIILTVFGLYEFFTLVERKGIQIYKYFGIVIGLIIPLSIYFKFELTKSWELLFIVAALLIIFLLQFTRRENKGAIEGVSTTLFGILYIAWFSSFLIKIKLLPGGAWLVAALLLITKSGDIGAYLIGTKYGRHSLIARISPQKSIEGAVGGIIFSVLAALASKVFIPGFSYLHLVLLGVGLGILGQLGDLSESLIKRDCHIKDSGHIFPGMGGVLDIIDSLLFTAPVFYFLMSVFIDKAL